MFALVHRLLKDTTESLEVIRNGELIACLSTRKPVAENPHICSGRLPEGLYAIFTLKSHTASISEFYETVVNYWLPAGKYKPAGSEPYVLFPSHPARVEPENRLAEMYIPLAGSAAAR